MSQIRKYNFLGLEFETVPVLLQNIAQIAEDLRRDGDSFPLDLSQVVLLITQETENYGSDEVFASLGTLTGLNTGRLTMLNLSGELFHPGIDWMLVDEQYEYFWEPGYLGMTTEMGLVGISQIPSQINNYILAAQREGTLVGH